MDNMQDTATATAMVTVGMVTGYMDTVDTVMDMGTDMDIIMVMADIITENEW